MSGEAFTVPPEIAAAILGAVQGLTEFLPVSSSGHLAFFSSFLPSLGADGVAFDLLLHIGTLLPVLFVYRRDLLNISSDLFSGTEPFLKREGVSLLMLLVIGSIPTAVLGLGFKDTFESFRENLVYVGCFFAITATMLYCIRFAPRGERGLKLFTWKHALAIGLVQGLAIAPGISRSGSTIAMALFLGINRQLAAKYSFLLSIPAILGAFVLKLDELLITSENAVAFGVGFCVSAAVGYLALVILIRLVKSGDFSKFCWYLYPLAAVSIYLGLR